MNPRKCIKGFGAAPSELEGSYVMQHAAAMTLCTVVAKAGIYNETCIEDCSGTTLFMVMQSKHCQHTKVGEACL